MDFVEWEPAGTGVGGNQPNRNNLWRVAEAGLQNLCAGHFHLQAWKELGCSTPLFWLGL